MAPPKIKVQGVGSIPSGYFLGRTTAGRGDVELLSHVDVAHIVASTGVVSKPGDAGTVAIATTTTVGVVKVDGITITVDGAGKISVVSSAIGTAPNGMLPLVTGDTTPGNQPFFITDGVGQCIGVPL